MTKILELADELEWLEFLHRPVKETVVIHKGGKGSGHFQHAGRKGQVGGSIPDKGASISKFAPGSVPTEEESDRSFSNGILINYFTHLGKDKTLEMVQRKVANSQMADKGIALASMSKYYEDDIWFLKAQTVAYLAADTNVEYDEVNDVIANWAISSNDSNIESLLSQQAVDEEFGLDVELSEWQKKKLEMIESYGQLSMDKRRSIIRSMYERTQRDLADAGYKPDDSVILYRGLQHDDFFGKKGDIIRYEGNAMESWTFDHNIATRFANGVLEESSSFGYVLEMKVPIRNILSTPRTGYGCYDEAEVVIFGSIPGNRVSISKVHAFEEAYND